MLRFLLPFSLLALLLVFLLSILVGAIWFKISDLSMFPNWLNQPAEHLDLKYRILFEIRMPRAICCLFVGAGLSVCGALLQAFFNNPIAEPGLLGLSQGSAFGASIYFVFGSNIIADFSWVSLSSFAFGGAVISFIFLIIFARSTFNQSYNHNSEFLIIGIAISSLFSSGVGLASFLARDPQARSITFWNLGTLSGSNWGCLPELSIVVSIVTFVSVRLGKSLNLMALGAESARMLNVNVIQLKWTMLFLIASVIAVITSNFGVIGFVGLIVPQIIRRIGIQDNRILILFSAIFGAILVSISDILSRIVIAPAELPIGILTSLIGVPFLLSNIKNKINE